jgi:hypothetical protein
LRRRPGIALNEHFEGDGEIVFERLSANHPLQRRNLGFVFLEQTSSSKAPTSYF